MLNQIKNAIQNSLSVEARTKNQYNQYPVIVQDTAQESITKGWSLTYYPRLLTNGQPRLYDGKEAFTSLSIANFKNLYTTIMAVDQRFANGESVEIGNDKRKRAVYDMGAARFSVVQYEQNVSITVTITQEASPFYMLSMNFRVVNSNKEGGGRHLIGSENQWDLNTDIFVEHNASLAPKKKRVLQVHQESANSVPYIKAPSRPGYIQNTTEVDPENSPFEYVQDVRSKFKALAVIMEQTIIEVAMEKALPLIQSAQAPQQPEQISFGSFGSQTQSQSSFGAPAFGAQAQAIGGQPAASEPRNWGAPVGTDGQRIF